MVDSNFYISRRKYPPTNKLPSEVRESMKIQDDQLTVKNTIGFRSIKAEIGSEKNIFFEITALSDSGIRIGFTTEEAEMNGPVGMDEFGYSIGSEGYSFFNSIRNVYCSGFSKNDIIGAVLHRNDKSSFIKYFKNGNDLGLAFVEIKNDIFYPTVALFYESSVCFNFGPFYAYPIE